MAILDWYKKTDMKQFRLGGLAGSGKSSILPFVVERLGLDEYDVEYACPTNRACDELRPKLEAHGIRSRVQTLSRMFRNHYRKHTPGCPADRDPSQECARDCKSELKSVSKGIVGHGKLLVCDESSMISQDLYDDIRYSGWRTLFTGDHGQLPPVGSRLSLMENPDFALETSRRQGEGSAIIEVAYAARRGESIGQGWHGKEVLKKRRYGDLKWEGKEDRLVLAWKNSKRCEINEAARAALGRSGPPQVGEPVIAMESSGGMRNSMRAVIAEVRPYRENYEMQLRFTNGRLQKVLALASQFGSETVRGGAEDKAKLDWAYSMTVHKAQGAQSDEVVLYDASGLRDWKPEEYRRWLYTGITRAAKRLLIVG